MRVSPLIIAALLIFSSVVCGQKAGSRMGRRARIAAFGLGLYKGSAAELLPEKVGAYAKKGDPKCGLRGTEFERKVKMKEHCEAQYSSLNDLKFDVITFASIDEARAALGAFLKEEFTGRAPEWRIQQSLKRKGEQKVGERYTLRHSYKNRPDVEKVFVIWRNGSGIFSVSGMGMSKPSLSVLEEFEKAYSY
jgi:hypothetical protein